MYQAKVYKIMIGAPSDIEEEVQVASDVLKHWNDLHSDQNKIVLLPLHWSFSSYPSMGNHPQKSLDKQLVEKSDLMVCVFGTRLGTPTETEISGTVEEINEHKKAGKDVMIFFKLSTNDITSIDPLQLQKINDFKKMIKNSTLWCDFTDAADFKQKLSDKLQLYINDNWVTEQTSPQPIESTSIIESFSDLDNERLIEWTKGENISFRKDYMGGLSSYFIGYKQYDIVEPRKKAEWDDFYERLLKLDFAYKGYSKSGNPIYKLTKKAYDYVETIIIEE